MSDTDQVLESVADAEPNEPVVTEAPEEPAVTEEPEVTEEVAEEVADEPPIARELQTFPLDSPAHELLVSCFRKS